MNDFLKKNKNKIIYILINLFVFCIMLAINSVYPFCWDDKEFAQSFSADTWTIKDILVHTYYNYYLKWSGKLIPFSVVLVFTLLDKMAYNIVNSLMYVLFANVIYKFFWNKKYDCWMLSAIYASLWLFIPWFGTVVFWVDGTVEYLWMLIPVLILGMIYFKEYFSDSTMMPNTAKRSAIGMFLLGLLAGCGLEATGSALVFGLNAMFVAKKIKKQEIALWQITGFTGTLIGFAFLMLAPGNYKRVQAVTSRSDIYSNFFYRIARESYFFVIYMGALLGISIGLLIIQYVCCRNEKNTRGGKISASGKLLDYYSICKESIVLIVLAVISVYVMTFVSAFAVRIFMTPTVLLIISCGISIRNISESEMGADVLFKFHKAIKVFMIFVFIYVIAQMLTAYIFCFYTGEPVTKNIQYTNILNDVRLFN